MWPGSIQQCQSARPHESATFLSSASRCSTTTHAGRRDPPSSVLPGAASSKCGDRHASTCFAAGPSHLRYACILADGAWPKLYRRSTPTTSRQIWHQQQRTAGSAIRHSPDPPAATHMLSEPDWNIPRKRWEEGRAPALLRFGLGVGNANE